MGAKGMVFRAWAHERAPLNSQWLVLRIDGADFLHSWVADSIQGGGTPLQPVLRAATAVKILTEFFL